MARQAIETQVLFPSSGTPSVQLEGLLGSFPDKVRHPAAVLCHPGNRGQTGMEYPVIAVCCRALREIGFVTLRFNFRGVQGSGGSRSSGLHEAHDVHGALRFMRERADVDPSHLYLVGNSFGAQMVLEAARDDDQVAGMVCIVLPLALLPAEPDYLRRDPRPKLFVVAGRDQFCDSEAFTALYESWAAPKDIVLITDTDHFLGIGPSSDGTDRSASIAEAVSSWLDRVSAMTR